MRNVTLRNVNHTIVPTGYGTHPYAIVRCEDGPRDPIQRRVQRWDVYDAADRLADIPWLIAKHSHDPRMLRVIARYAQIVAGDMFRMAERGGSVADCSTGYAGIGE